MDTTSDHAICRDNLLNDKCGVGPEHDEFAVSHVNYTHDAKGDSETYRC